MKTLNTRSLPDVANGLLAAAIDSALQKVHADLDDRDGVDKDRTVTIKLKLRPARGDRNEDDGTKADRVSQLEAARIQFEVNHTLPSQTFTRKMLNVGSKNAFGFNPDTNSIKSLPGQAVMPFSVDDDDHESDE